MICLSWGPECGGVLANIGFLPAVFLEAEVLLCSWAGGGGSGMHFYKTCYSGYKALQIPIKVAVDNKQKQQHHHQMISAEFPRVLHFILHQQFLSAYPQKVECLMMA